MGDISLKQLEVFVAVVECGSFTEAAEKLFLAQSTVSSHIGSLKERLRVPLFSGESRKSIVLTADGRRVYQYAKEIIAKCAALEEDAAGEGERELIIGASSVPSAYILPALVKEFLNLHPGCFCTMKSGDSDGVAAMLREGSISVGFVGSSSDRKDLAYERIGEDHMVLVAPDSQRFREMRQRGASGRELLEEPMICREHGSGTQQMVDNYLGGINFDAKRMHPIAYVSDPAAQKALISLGAGVTILSSLAAEEMARQGGVLCFELDGVPAKRAIYMACRRRGSHSALTEAFLAFVRGRLGENQGT